MIVRADALSVVSIPDFVMVDSAALRFDSALVDVLGAWYQIHERRASLSFVDGQLRGVGRYEGGSLELEVRACSPVTGERARLEVVALDREVTVELDLRGAPLFLRERIRVSFQQVRQGTLHAQLAIPNDGSVACTGGTLWVTPSAGTAIAAVLRDNSVLEPVFHRERPGAVRVPLNVAVGEAVTYDLVLAKQPGVSEVQLFGEVLAHDAMCTFDSHVETVEPLATELTVLRTEDAIVPMQSTFTASIMHDGPTIVDARLSALGEDIEPAVIQIGNVLPGELRRMPLTIACVRAIGEKHVADVAFRLQDGADAVLAETIVPVEFYAPCAIETTAKAEPVGHRGELQISLNVRNIGFTRANGYAIRFHSDEPLSYVADSLLIGDTPMADIDGRWNEDDAFVLPDMEAGADVLVRFRARSARDCVVPMEIVVLRGDRTVERLCARISFSAFVTGRVDGASAVAEPARESTSVLDDERTPVIEPSAPIAALPVPQQTNEVEQPTPLVEPVNTTGMNGAVSPAAADRLPSDEDLDAALQQPLFEDAEAKAADSSGNVSSEPQTNDAQVQQTQDELPGDDPGAFRNHKQVERHLSAAAREIYGDGEVELGRHVLVVLSCAPDDLLEPANELIAQYLPGLREGMFGISGHAYDSAALRGALATRLGREGTSMPPDAAPNEIVARALTFATLPGPHAESFGAYRDAIVARVLQARSDISYDEIVSEPTLMEAVAA